jgi:hypothetical protein
MLNDARRKRALSGFSIALIASVAVLGTAISSPAQAEKGCTEWTLFPDFRCPDREARPEGAFNPMGMPYLFEDPYITTGLNFVYIYHRTPDTGGLGVAFDGGGIHVLALQIRVALTDKLGFIATKDGLAIQQFGKAALIENNTGIFDMTMGFKYNLFESKEHNFIFTPAVRYEIPMGSKKQFQNYGSGVFIPSASFRWGLADLGLDAANVVGSIGGQVPADGNRNSASMFYNLHFDYGFKMDAGVVKYIVPFFEMNGIYYTSSGDGQNRLYLKGGARPTFEDVLPLTGPFEGVDVANLGSQLISGKNVIVLGGGFRVPTTWGISFGVMYEGPVTSRSDIHGQRFTFMATWEL